MLVSKFKQNINLFITNRVVVGKFKHSIKLFIANIFLLASVLFITKISNYLVQTNLICY